MEKNLNRSFERLNFADAIQSAKHISQFIEETTNSKINYLVQPDVMKEADAVIVDAAYFKGQWVR